jgi:hypothetical protein
MPKLHIGVSVLRAKQQKHLQAAGELTNMFAG